ncbi:MAG: type II restriction endonuclease [Peptoniphilus sp.]|uniref:type II restriction enzyme n=1 Tax=Peptoniphilus sp. TaxID=1971214 RepID=UPI0025EB2E99|nr:type II restriction endonuclease [Peptoniphilus sp.]MCI5643163.1 type II restriction endonuclease [Peptoniphilus sp.]MDD7353011.1 type II restriction endonuclease [Peptoniphilaceae bacterium]MDY3902621.1 type II restriction endonuclease [Peptoniphilus sp.]
MAKISTNSAWEKLFDKYNIEKEVNEKGFFNIKAEQIKEFKEPRLMAKWDSSESLPSILKSKEINILPTSRSSYILSNFNLYKELPKYTEDVTKMKKVEIPDLESIDIENVTSEANAINVLMLSPILEDFLGDGENYATFNGRMGTGEFNFFVNRNLKDPLCIDVKNAQCEIDAGLENDKSVVIIEAKNVIHPDFHVRQLYYPYRLWRNKVKKPIRLLFSIYSNQIYRLLEYRFNDLNNYSSIELIKEKNYTLQDTKITCYDLLEVYKKTKVTISDNMNDYEKTPFVQADSFEKIISLIDFLKEEDMSPAKVAEIMQFDIRQAGYYFNAGKYLGIFEKYHGEEFDEESSKWNKVVKIRLTKKGQEIAKMNYKPRQLELVKLILRHKIFNVFFFETFTTGQFPKKKDIENAMRKYNVCNEGQITRRASTVYSWLKWIFRLQKVTQE